MSPNKLRIIGWLLFIGGMICLVAGTERYGYDMPWLMKIGYAAVVISILLNMVVVWLRHQAQFRRPPAPPEDDDGQDDDSPAAAK